MHSRSRSAWPQRRAYSSIMRTSTSRRCLCPPWMVPRGPQQRHRGAWYGAARQLLDVEVGALHFQGVAIVPQVIVPYAMLVRRHRGARTRIVLRIGPHVGVGGRTRDRRCPTAPERVVIDAHYKPLARGSDRTWDPAPHSTARSAQQWPAATR